MEERIKKEVYKKAYKPYDVVTDKDGNVGFIQEVNVKLTCATYSVKWIVKNQTITAWWEHEELTKHCNIFEKIAENSCHPFGNGKDQIQKLFEEW